MPGRVILLNGVGSAGKSSIARALQAIATTPFLHVQMDAFLDMLPEALQDHPEAFRYRSVTEDGQPAVAIETGSVAFASCAACAELSRRWHARATISSSTTC